MRRAAVVLLLLGLAGCDVGEPDEPPPDPATRAVDPAPTEPSEYLEFGDTGAQPDQLPGGGFATPALRLRLRVVGDGCTVRRVGRVPVSETEGLAWMVSSSDGTATDERGTLPVFRPRLRGTAVVALVVREPTDGGVTVRQVSNTVRVRCR